MITKTKTKKWGNSLGIVIPKEAVENMNLKLGEFVVVDIQKKENVLKELFGSAKFKKSSKEMIKEFREDFESKWMK